MASASVSPSASPSVSPSASFSVSPSVSFSRSPSVSVSGSPSISVSSSPSVSPSVSVSNSPSVSPSPSPSAEQFQVISPMAIGGLRGVMIVKWAGLNLTGDTGKPYACPNFADKSVQVVANEWLGGISVVIEGSNMITPPLTYEALTDPMGLSLTFTANGIKQIMENTFWVRPRVVGGSINRVIDVYLLIHTDK